MEKKKTRSSNIELLRILAMFMIVIYHITCHCVTVQLTDPGSMGRTVVDTFNHPVFYTRLLILNSLMTFGIIGNAIFILISGYFMATRGGTEVKIGSVSKKLLLQLGFASILLVCVPPIVHHLRPGIFINMFNITWFNGMSWFVGYYYLVVLCGALFLNNFLKNLDYKKYLVFLLTIFGVTQFSWSAGLANALASGLNTLLTGIFLYSLGGFIREFDPFKKVRTYVFFLITFLMYVLIWISGYNVTSTSIETYNRSGSTDSFIQSVPGFDNASIVIVILAICLFEIFRRIHLPESKVITFIGRATFMVYLIHDNSLFYEIWNLRDWITTLAESPMMFILNVLKWATYTFVIGVLAYALYVLVMDLLKRCRRLAIKD